MTGRQQIKVIAVVLNWRDTDATMQCLDSLLREKLLASVVLVDNESSGELRSAVSDRVQLVENPENLGFAKGVNSGIHKAMTLGADAVFVINNDATVREGALEKLIKAWVSTEEPVLLAPRVVNLDGTDQSTGGYFRAVDASTRDLGNKYVNYLTWACVLLPVATIKILGLLDERFFMYWEDVDYGLRASKAGVRMRLVDDAHVEHERSKSHSRAGAKIEGYSAAGLTLLCLKRGGVALFVGLPYRLIGRLLTRLGSPGRVRSIARGFLAGCRAFRGKAAPSA
ncbi:glycosyltransferase family 2 protein [Microbacterium oleivorans]|uniref:Putative glycosyltransferase n=1 Tax=Microbacterium oleivorans TaxID=273677 RepID=A0A031FW05_9MICO|nr:glycosyltransferase family 2 protein [Microbacterium oleivorans]EZP29039.1 putative glycosyltransferase [Microbacterium oleivorans]